MYKIVFTDIDGTLLSHTSNSIPASARKTVEDLQKKGIQVWGCTGRHMQELQKMNLEGFHPDGWVLLNGALCIKGEDILYEAAIEEEDKKTLVDTVRNTPFPVQCLYKKDMYVNMLSDELLEGLAHIHTEPDPIDPIENVLKQPLYMFIPWGDQKTVDDMLHKMKHVSWVRWNEYAVDCFSTQCGKDNGVRAVCSALQIEKEEAIAIGDAENDIPMMREAGLSIAMGNAMDSVKKTADIVTDSIDEDGFAKAFAFLTE